MNFKILLGTIIILASIVTMMILKPSGNHAQMLGRSIGNFICVIIGAVLIFKGKQQAKRKGR